MRNVAESPAKPEKNDIGLERDTIFTDMEESVIRGIVNKDLASMSNLKGISNHMGSKATQDTRIISILFDEIKRKGLFFLNSMTTQRSVCSGIAGEMNIPYIERDIFIDNRLNKDLIEAQLTKAIDLAIKRGTCVAIGHDRDITIATLKEFTPKAREKGIEFVLLSQIIK